MKHVLLIVFFSGSVLVAQTLSECRQRFADYLNFRGSLNASVQFKEDALYLLKPNGEKELAIYAEELPAISAFLESSSIPRQQALFHAKGLSRFSKKQIDSLVALAGPARKSRQSSGSGALSGFRIALDPGHFGITMKEAASEQKYLRFVNPVKGQRPDTITIFESQLSFATAAILKKMLEERGATVMLTRDEAGHTSFGCSFTYWLSHHKKRVLDSLRAGGAISAQRYAKLIKSRERDLFWDFFRDYDLANRVEKINAFGPHATVVIHYNVDEKNAPWKAPGRKNYTMTFIGGAFTAGDLERPVNKADFLRLLLTDQINRSEKLAGKTVQYFNKNLDVKIADSQDADYLLKNCNKASQPGVFCRNLVLCRKINSPLVYGEALYQDNEKECVELQKKDVDIYGVKTNARVVAAARSYYAAVLEFLGND